MRVVARALAGLFWCAGAFAQFPINPNTTGGKSAIARFERLFVSKTATLACDVQPQKPILTFNLRHYAGYRLSLPIRQLEDESALTILFRVEPRDSEKAVYFRRNYRLPKLPRNVRADITLDGGFLLGEGVYDVDWILADGADRVCRKSWKTDLRLSAKERRRKQFLEPNTVAPLVLPVWRGTASVPGSRPFRIAFLLHAAPLHPRSAILSSYDRYVLATTLIALLESTPFREVSVAAFSLQQQSEIFQAPELDGRALNRLISVLDRLNLGTIDVSQMANPSGNVELLGHLVNRELSRDEPPDAIVFIGPNSRDDSRFPQSLIESDPGAKKPKFFYVHHDFYARRYPWPDPIERLVKGQGGRVFAIVEPDQLARAIQEIEKILSASAALEVPVAR